MREKTGGKEMIRELNKGELYQLAHAAARDVADRHMRKRGSKRWNKDDYSEASRILNKLLDALDYRA